MIKNKVDNYDTYNIMKRDLENNALSGNSKKILEIQLNIEKLTIMSDRYEINHIISDKSIGELMLLILNKIKNLINSQLCLYEEIPKNTITEEYKNYIDILKNDSISYQNSINMIKSCHNL